MTPADFIAMDDAAFLNAWRISDEFERHEYPAGFDRFRSIMGPTGRHLKDAARDQLDALPFEWASLTDLDSDPPPERRWVIPGWIPRGTVAGLFGAGGVGKSLLAQQWATQVANGLPIHGLDVSAGPVVALLAEDDTDEVRRRQRWILRALGRSAAYSCEDLWIEGRAGRDNALVAFGADRQPVKMALWDHLADACKTIRPVLVILDNIAQLFGGLENDRHQVTTFCNLLAGIATQRDCGVLLLGHVAKAEGSEYSGSTAWEAALRTRLWLERRPDGFLELHRKKANYAAAGESVVLEFQGGAFFEVKTGIDDDSASVKGAESVVLGALETFTSRQVATSQAPHATTYLVRMAAREGLLNGTPLPLASRALNCLIDRGDVVVGAELGWRARDRHKARGLAVKSS